MTLTGAKRLCSRASFMALKLGANMWIWMAVFGTRGSIYVTDCSNSETTVDSIPLTVLIKMSRTVTLGLSVRTSVPWPATAGAWNRPAYRALIISSCQCPPVLRQTLSKHSHYTHSPTIPAECDIITRFLCVIHFIRTFRNDLIFICQIVFSSRILP